MMQSEILRLWMSAAGIHSGNGFSALFLGCLPGYERNDYICVEDSAMRRKRGRECY
jgi:hypothetical protein